MATTRTVTGAVYQSAKKVEFSGFINLSWPYQLGPGHLKWLNWSWDLTTKCYFIYETKYCSSQGRAGVMRLQWVMQRPAANIKLSAVQGAINALMRPAGIRYLLDRHCIPITSPLTQYLLFRFLWPVMTARAVATLMPRMMRFDHSRRTPTPSPLACPASPTVSRSNSTALSWLKLENLAPPLTWLLFLLRSTFACLGLALSAVSDGQVSEDQWVMLADHLSHSGTWIRARGTWPGPPHSWEPLHSSWLHLKSSRWSEPCWKFQCHPDPRHCPAGVGHLCQHWLALDHLRIRRMT